MNSPFKQLLYRSLKYRSLFALSITSNIIVAIATLASVPTILPLITLLFDHDKIAQAPLHAPTEKLSFLNAKEHLNYELQDYFANIPAEQAILKACLFILFVFLIKNLFQYIVYVANGRLRNYVGKDLRDDMMDKLLNLAPKSIGGDKKGDLITRLSSDVRIIEDGFFGVIETVFKSPLVIIGCIVFMLVISVKLTLFVVALIVFTVVVIGGISRALRKQTTAAQNAFGEMVSTFEESITGIKTVKAFHAQEHVSDLFRRKNQNYINIAIRILQRRDLSSPLSEFLGITVVAILLWYGSRLVFSGALDSSLFLTFIFAFYNIIDPAKKFSNASYRVQEAIGAYDRIAEVLDRPDERQTMRLAAVAKTTFDHQIEIKNVSFTYDNSEEEVLKGISLTIKKGMTVALVGSSGSGKSTLADLICRFLRPTKGQILLDGVPLGDITEASLRELITLVQQEAILFNESIKENVEFGFNKSSDQSLTQALDAANASEFVDQMEAGIHTGVGDGGNRLSGGQRQRLSLARALLRETPILILDEATSALDSKSEKYIQEALERVTRDRTSIIIAHRLTTIQNADCIFVLEQGKIIESGTHDDLLKKDSGVYAKFVELQRLSE